MQERRNCWEVMKCGREPGGAQAGELGACPSAEDQRFDGVNNGKNGGRFCWAVAGTLCGGKQQGTFAQKLENCFNCRFYREVELQEGKSTVFMPSDAKK